MELPRIEGDITVDGRVTETAWDDLSPLPLTMYQPTYEGDIKEQTEIRVGYDDESLYVSGRLYNSDPDGTYNIGYGLDGVFRLFGDEYLTVKGAQTVDHALVQDNAFDPLDATLGFLRWERRRSEGLYYQSTVRRVGDDYRPDVGFVTREDFTEGSGRAAYGWFPEDASFVRKVTPTVNGTTVVRNADGSVESARAAPGWYVEFK
jgi:hypothetical protein